MIFFEKKHEFGTNYIDFLEKKLKSVFFFEKNPNFIKIFMIFFEKKHEFGTNSIDFLEKKAEKCDFF